MKFLFKIPAQQALEKEQKKTVIIVKYSLQLKFCDTLSNIHIFKLLQRAPHGELIPGFFPTMGALTAIDILHRASGDFTVMMNFRPCMLCSNVSIMSVTLYRSLSPMYALVRELFQRVD